MKELSIEEKARRYDEAIKIAKRNYENIAKMDKDCTFSKEVIVYTFHHIFPELKESERIRMIKFISNELACIRATDEKGSDRYDELTEAIDGLKIKVIRYQTIMSNQSLKLVIGLLMINCLSVK